MVNVPAHPWLWSSADEFLGHVRRYRAAASARRSWPHGFRTRLVTHVFSWLVPAACGPRGGWPRPGPELGLDRTSLLIDSAAAALTLLERTLVGRWSLPFGTSILCVAEKPESAHAAQHVTNAIDTHTST